MGIQRGRGIAVDGKWAAIDAEWCGYQRVAKEPLLRTCANGKTTDDGTILLGQRVVAAMVEG